MNKIFYLFAFFYLTVLTAHAQYKIENPYKPAGYTYNLENLSTADEPCGFLAKMKLQENKGYYRRGVDSIINTLIQNNRQRSGNPVFTTTDYVIPVIFHIIHEPGEAPGSGFNISQASVNANIEQLNTDFANLSGSTWPQAADAHISFCPVTVDMNGNPLAEPGIERIDRVAAGFTDFRTFTVNMDLIQYVDDNVKPVTYWDPNKVLNIWVLPTFQTGGLGGYATYPDLFPLYGMPGTENPEQCGVVVNSGFVGGFSAPGNGDSRFIYGRNTAHEIAHYLGLIHLWGERSDCTGTDYCEDTPPCRTSYVSAAPGCSQGPAGERCGTHPRMVNNYLEYSHDLCRNTFTQDQVERMQIVMQYAPNRPRQPYPVLCAPGSSNAIGFKEANAAFAEGDMNSCGGFTDHLVTLRPTGAATGSAAINLNFSGTATQGVDYDVIGATSFVYSAGELAEKSLTIRVYNDNVKEADETIIIDYTISGSGLTAGNINQQFVMHILNDDIEFELDNLAPERVLYAENFDTTANGYLPRYWLQGAISDNAASNVFTINSVYAGSGFSAADGKVLHITNSNSNLQIAGTAVNDYTKTLKSHYVVITPDIDVRGYHNLKLSFDYASVGEGTDTTGDVGYVAVTSESQYNDFKLLPVILSNTASKTHIQVDLPDTLNNREKIYIVFGWMNNANGTGSPVPLNIDNVQVSGDVAGIETMLNSRSALVRSTESIQFVDDDSKIIAKLEDLNESVGCIEASVTQAGTGKLPLETTAGNFMRSEKVITVSPASLNTTAGYSLTLYFTTEELAAWTDPLSLKVAKVSDGVALSSILTNANTVILNPVVSDLRSTKGFVSYTIDVSNGFSQFFLVDNDIALPVKLLSFTATADENSIELNWLTGSEINNKGFYLKRGTSPAVLSNIRWVPAKLAAMNGASYYFDDVEALPGVDYYYQLQQVDIDGAITYSDLRKARIGKELNPFSIVGQNSTLFLASTVQGTAGVEIYTVNGRLIYKSRLLLKSLQPIEAKLASGTYILRIHYGGRLFSLRAIVI